MSEQDNSLVKAWKQIVPFDVTKKECSSCSIEFSVTHHIHFCKHCGKSICSDCGIETSFQNDLTLRLCKFCFTHLQTLCSKNSDGHEIKKEKIDKHFLPMSYPNSIFELKNTLENLRRVVLHPVEIDSSNSHNNNHSQIPKLHFLIFLTGSRGDVQPFIALGKQMKEYGHCITIATHSCFSDVIKKENLEFYPLPGDPEELMELMVSDVDLDLLRNKLPKHREWIKDLLKASWKACQETEDGVPTVIDAIIANPPSFVGPHLAEKLWCPLFMSFTMPWTPTCSFASPFINTNVGDYTNYYSYQAVDAAIWTGMKDLINDWRKNDLKIEPIHTGNFSGHLLIHNRKVPFIYGFSEILVPRPDDWDEHVHITGFWFVEKSNWKPDEKLQKFLDSGDKPIYVGFGSIVMSNPKEFTKKVLDGIKQANVRAIVQSGWTKMDSDETDENIFFIDKAPHDSLFPLCSAVVHHGGAGTTSNGLRAGKPTLIIPFFGDQYFWGKMIHEQKAGPKPIPNKKLTPENFANAIKECLELEDNAKEIGNKIEQEKGIQKAIDVIHSHIPTEDLTCDTCPDIGEHHPARVICLDCKLKLCSRDNEIIHYMVPDMSHHRRHRNRVVQWNEHLDTNIKSVGDGRVNGEDTNGVLGVVKGFGRGVASFVASTVETPVNILTSNKMYEECPFGTPEVFKEPIPNEICSKVLSVYKNHIQDNLVNYGPNKS